MEEPTQAFQALWIVGRCTIRMQGMKKDGSTLLFFVLICSAYYLLSCKPAQSVSAQVPDCTTERFYDGPTETRNYIQFATQACVIGVPAEETMTLKYDHLIQRINLQMGSNTGSELEWDFCVTMEPPGKDPLSECMQFDKHTDAVGNKTDTRVYPVPLHLPAGTLIKIQRRIIPEAYCTKPGPYGNGGHACATGQRADFIGVIQ